MFKTGANLPRAIFAATLIGVVVAASDGGAPDIKTKWLNEEKDLGVGTMVFRVYSLQRFDVGYIARMFKESKIEVHWSKVFNFGVCQNHPHKFIQRHRNKDVRKVRYTELSYNGVRGCWLGKAKVKGNPEHRLQFLHTTWELHDIKSSFFNEEPNIPKIVKVRDGSIFTATVTRDDKLRFLLNYDYKTHWPKDLSGHDQLEVPGKELKMAICEYEHDYRQHACKQNLGEKAPTNISPLFQRMVLEQKLSRADVSASSSTSPKLRRMKPRPKEKSKIAKKEPVSKDERAARAQRPCVQNAKEPRSKYSPNGTCERKVFEKIFKDHEIATRQGHYKHLF